MGEDSKYCTFENIVEARRRLIESHRENGFNLNDLLAEQYSDPSHFLYELLQNAEDEGATEVEIHLYTDRFLLKHNGKPFDIKDIDGVTGLGNSKKQENLNAIGKFGLGFKSVFALTQTPKIYSGDYSFKIKDFFLPERLSDKPEHLKKEETLIELPFNHQERSPQDVYRIVKNRIENLGMITLLFLKNIEFVSWYIYDDGNGVVGSGQYLKETRKVDQNVSEVQLISSKNGEYQEKAYLLFEDYILVDGIQRRIQTAFLIKDGNVVPEDQDTNLVVYFPTEKKVYLRFLINAPFRTTPNREGVPFEDDKNRELLNGVLHLIKKSMLWLRNNSYIGREFLEVLPYNQENLDRDPDVFKSVYETVKELINEEPLLPSVRSGEYLKGKEAVMPRGTELTNLLNSEDLNMLFGKKNWITGNIPSDGWSPLRRFLKDELGVEEIDSEKLVQTLSKLSKEELEKFLMSKTDEWVKNFYTLLSNVKYLWNRIKTLPIIRLEDGTHTSPCDDKGNIRVYLPSEEYKNLGLRTVKERVFKGSEKAEEFLRGIGINEPDTKTSVKERVQEIISKYDYPEEVPVSYMDDFRNVFNIWKQEHFKKEVEDILEQGVHFVLAKNSKSGERKLVKPDECYYPDEALEEYFRGCDVWFVDESLTQIAESEIREFLLSIGVEDKPRIKHKVYEKGKGTRRYYYNEPPGNLMNDIQNFMEERESGEWTWTYIKVKEPIMEGLDTFLSQPVTKERSKILWNILNRRIEHIQSKKDIETMFQREITWTYYRDYKAYMDSDLLKTLKYKPWIYNKEGYVCSPVNILQSELNPMYEVNDFRSSYLLEVLCGELEEVIDRLPTLFRHLYEAIRERGIDPNNIPPEKIDEFVKSLLEEDMEDTWQPNVEPEEVKLKGEDFEVEETQIRIDDLINKEPTEDGGSDNKNPSVKPNPPTKYTKKIGEWGERAVLNALKKEYSKKGNISETNSGFIVRTEKGEIYEIIWLNAERDMGKGYDILVKKNGEEFEFIEVKTKEDEDPHLFSVTGTQWELAKALHEKGEGKKYKIYIVSSSGTSAAKYRILPDPYGMWKEGNIYAHPVNIRL